MPYLLENNADDVIYNTHPESSCAGQDACPIHHLTNHHMRHMPQVFRADNGLMERICEHGIGHPDPDGLHYFTERGIEGMDVHGCCGCCSLPTSLMEAIKS